MVDGDDHDGDDVSLIAEQALSLEEPISPLLASQLPSGGDAGAAGDGDATVDGDRDAADGDGTPGGDDGADATAAAAAEAELEIERRLKDIIYSVNRCGPDITSAQRLWQIIEKEEEQRKAAGKDMASLGRARKNTASGRNTETPKEN